MMPLFPALEGGMNQVRLSIVGSHLSLAILRIEW